MTQRRWWALALAALGCGREAAPSPRIKEPEVAVTPAHDAPLPATSAPDGTSVPMGETPKPPAQPVAMGETPKPPVQPAPPPFLLTELSPAQGDLAPLLRAQAERARDKHLLPVIEFYADWCAPCRAFQGSLDDPRMVEALRGTYLVKLNLDDWHDKLVGTGFTVRSIPAFYLVDSAGRPTGKMLDGDRWGKPTPASMSASLGKFLGR